MAFTNVFTHFSIMPSDLIFLMFYLEPFCYTGEYASSVVYTERNKHTIFDICDLFSSCLSAS